MVAIGALGVSFLSWPENRDRLFPGEVRLLSALPGYAVYRGVLSFPSDHLVIPITWRNSTNHPVVVSNPRLILTEAGKKRTLFMYEEVPEISDTAIQHYRHTSSVVLQPQSVSIHIAVFGTEQRWDSKHADYRFRFLRDTGNEPKAILEYLLIDKSSMSIKSTLLRDKFPLYPGIEGIQDGHYDYFWLR